MYVSRVFFLVTLVFVLVPGIFTSHSYAAEAPGQSQYEQLLRERNALAADARQASLRHRWENLAQRLDALAVKTPKGELAARIRFEEARTLEELAGRSFNSKDYAAAAAAYNRLGRQYPALAQGHEALVRAAAIKGKQLGDRPGAQRDLDALATRKPTAATARDAAALQRELGLNPSKAFVEASAVKAPTAPASVLARSNPKRAAAQYDSAAGAWRELVADAKRSQFRDPWLQLEKRFMQALASDPQGPVADKARFQAARCLEELAARSFLAGDWQGAVAHYTALARDFPKSDLADDGLYRAAVIQAQRLKDPQGAEANASLVLSRYPGGDMAGSAKELLQTLPGVSADKKAAQTVAAPSPPASLSSVPAPLTAGSGAYTSLRKIGWQRKGKIVTASFELSQPVQFRHQYLAGTGTTPARLQLDMEGVKPVAQVPQQMAINRAPVTRVLTTHLGSESTRVLIECSELRQYKVSTALNPPRIIVQLSTAAALDGALTVSGQRAVETAYQGGFGPAASARPSSLVEQLGLTVNSIMIDPGHGGKDPGAMGNGIRENRVTLRLAKALGAVLRKQGFTVLFTREIDKTVQLDARTVAANSKKADLFISLHVNANADKEISGFETYFLDLARTSSAAHLAARENAVSVKSISDLQVILSDLMLQSKLQESRELAGIIQNSSMARLHRAGFEVRDNGVRSAPFYVLMGAQMPAVLIEIGYLTHDGDARRIQSDTYLERLAEGIADGVVAYRAKLNRFAPKR